MTPVLLIDDDAALAEVLKGYLEPLGYDVEWEGDGRRGLERALRGGHAAVVLDVRVPGLSGLEVLRRIREATDVPVIILSALGDEADRIAGLEMGADDYLPKTASPRELLARLRSIIRRAPEPARFSPDAASTEPVDADLSAAPAPAGPESEHERDKEKKKKTKEKEKLRSAWISFIGRIVAQVVGAAATVWLGITVADRMRAPADVGTSAPRQSTAGEVSIAVLPFGNLSGDPKNDYLGDGLTEALIADLARIRALKVISRTSVMQYRAAPKPMPQIARELGVAYVLEGSVTPMGDRLRVTAQLLHAPSDNHLWTDTYDRPIRDLFALQDDVSARIVREVNAVLTPEEQQLIGRARSVDPNTHAAYLRARYTFQQGGAENARSAIQSLEETLARDPNHARAWVTLAQARLATASGLSPRDRPKETVAAARDAADKAIALEPGLAEAHVALAQVQYRFERDFAGAEASLKKALELAPGKATAHATLARLLMSLGRGDEAIAQERRAAELDPIAGRRAGFLAVTYFFSRRFDEALRENRLTRAADPEGRAFREFAAEVLLAAGRPKEALAELRREFPAPPEDDAALAVWGAVHAGNGNRAEAERIHARLAAEAKTRYIPPRTLVILEIALGRKDAAFATLQRAIEENSDLAHLLKVHPLLDPLRDDPRFAPLLARAGFR